MKYCCYYYCKCSYYCEIKLLMSSSSSSDRKVLLGKMSWYYSKRMLEFNVEGIVVWCYCCFCRFVVMRSCEIVRNLMKLWNRFWTAYRCAAKSKMLFERMLRFLLCKSIIGLLRRTCRLAVESEILFARRRSRRNTRWETRVVLRFTTQELILRTRLSRSRLQLHLSCTIQLVLQACIRSLNPKNRMNSRLIPSKVHANEVHCYLMGESHLKTYEIITITIILLLFYKSFSKNAIEKKRKRGGRVSRKFKIQKWGWVIELEIRNWL